VIFQLEKEYKILLQCRSCHILKPPTAFGLFCKECQIGMEEGWPELAELIEEFPDKDIAELEVMAIKGDKDAMDRS
jgi:hypothetical protein